LEVAATAAVNAPAPWHRLVDAASDLCTRCTTAVQPPQRGNHLGSALYVPCAILTRCGQCLDAQRARRAAAVRAPPSPAGRFGQTRLQRSQDEQPSTFVLFTGLLASWAPRNSALTKEHPLCSCVTSSLTQSTAVKLCVAHHGLRGSTSELYRFLLQRSSGLTSTACLYLQFPKTTLCNNSRSIRQAAAEAAQRKAADAKITRFDLQGCLQQLGCHQAGWCCRCGGSCDSTPAANPP
jgi:hypothetical protein